MNKFNNSALAQYFLKPDNALLLKDNEWLVVLHAFQSAKLLAAFYYRAAEHNVLGKLPNFVQLRLHAAKVYADKQYQQVIFESYTMRVLLEKIGVSPIFLKGAAYILRGSTNARGRIMSDIDILVDKSELAKVERQLKSNLWIAKKVDDYDEKYYREWAHEIPPMFHAVRDTVVDVHHNLFPPISGRAPNIADFINNCELVTESCTVLGPPATVLHSIIHLFLNDDLSGSYRDLFDILFLLQEFTKENWTELIELSEKTGFKKELDICLDLIEKIFDIRFHGAKIHFSNRILSSLFYYAITPNVPILNKKKVKLAQLLLFIRAHYLKMPLLILIKHLSFKLYRGAVKIVLGEHVFSVNKEK